MFRTLIKKTLAITLAIFLTLASVLAALEIFKYTEASAATIAQNGSTLEITFSPRATFLRAEPYKPNDRPRYGGGDPESPAIIDLQTNGFLQGDTIMISIDNATWDTDAYWESPYPNLEHDQSDPKTSIIGVFSLTDELLGTNVQNRVPGAINYGENYPTDPTYFDGLETDIPEDFRVSPYTGKVVQVPNNAQWLFLCVDDSFYPDNVGTIKISIEKDSDGDGLPDSWEIDGIDIDGDGEVDLDLPMLGADWQHKDIFVEIDYMGVSTDPTHRPRPTAIDAVKEAFAKAPVLNPDGIMGINLHVFVNEEIPHQTVLPMWSGFENIKNSTFGLSDEERNAPNTIAAKKLVFHYGLFIHGWSEGGVQKSTWGMADTPGADFVVAVPSTSSTDQQAATLMHELGHNLGLEHGGNDRKNYKPNYLSIMNYLFEFEGDPVPGRPLDFSRQALPTLNESNLDEQLGIQGPTGSLTAFSQPPGNTPQSVWSDSAIDWNGDSNLTIGVNANINNFPQWNYTSPEKENLTGYNDWRNLVYRFRGIPGFGEGNHPNEFAEEMSQELFQLLADAALPYPSPPPVIPEFTVWMMPPLLVFLTFAVMAYRKKIKQI